MRIFKRCLKITFLVLGLLTLVGGHFSLLFAQEEVTETYPPQVSREECLNTFDVNKLDYMEYKVIINIPLLAEYFQCRAAVRDDENECDNLNPRPDYVASCGEYFNEYRGFYGRLLNEGQVTPQMLRSCMSNIKISREECELFAKSWLANDLSYCDKYRKRDRTRYDECRAMISGDSTLCKSDSCINTSTYVRAIKTANIKDCVKIEDDMTRAVCQGAISMDEKICENNAGFKEFRNRYCE